MCVRVHVCVCVCVCVLPMLLQVNDLYDILLDTSRPNVSVVRHITGIFANLTRISLLFTPTHTQRERERERRKGEGDQEEERERERERLRDALSNCMCMFI